LGRGGGGFIQNKGNKKSKGICKNSLDGLFDLLIGWQSRTFKGYQAIHRAH